MKQRLSSLQSLRRVFRYNFSAYDVAELLISCDRDRDAQSTRQFMDSRGLEVAGVLDEGRVVGYVQRDELNQGQCGDHLQPFGQQQVILDSTSLPDTILLLDRYPRLFVSVFGGIGGIITRTDMQKPPSRMWLFGMITLIEMQMSRRIEDTFGEIEWRQYLSEGRFDKAALLAQDRSKLGQPTRLIECLQFSDKCDIIAGCEPLRRAAGFDSKKGFLKTVKRIEHLRDCLAHSQKEFISSNWQALVDLANYVDVLIDDTKD